MVIFHCHVSSPEGIYIYIPLQLSIVILEEPGQDVCQTLWDENGNQLLARNRRFCKIRVRLYVGNIIAIVFEKGYLWSQVSDFVCNSPETPKLDSTNMVGKRIAR